MNNSHPPKLLLWFFRWYCDPDFAEDIEGDLLERFEHRVEEQGSKYAKWHFTKDVLRLFRPGIIKTLSGTKKMNQYDMFKNYIKIAFRNIGKQRTSSLLNIMGLSLGIASSLLIILHVKQELSYEDSFGDAENTYRISNTNWAKTSPPLKEFLQTNLPEAKLVSQIAAFGNEVVKTAHYKAEVANGYYVDAEFFEIFGLNFTKRTSGKISNAPFKVVLTQSMAKQFFGDNEAVGDFITLADKDAYEVVGVIEDLPKNSHLKMDYFVTMSTFYKHTPASWTSNPNWMVTYTYALIEERVDRGEFEAKLREATYAFYPDGSREEVDQAEAILRPYPIKSIHLHSKKEQEMAANSDVKFVYIFAALALFIMLIACANFINIFTTQAIKRAKEIGVRKVLGAKKRQLVVQFLSEAFITTLLATLVGVLLASLALPSYNQLVSLPLSYMDLFTNTNMYILLSLVLTVGFFSGTYPAFHIARQRSLSALKSQRAPKSSGNIVRKVLVVFQFSVSIVMMTGTLVLLLQTNYIQSKDLGFNKDQVVAIKFYGEFRQHLRKHWEAFHSELTQNTHIINASLASNLIGDRLSVEYVTPVGSKPGMDFPGSKLMRVDAHYLETMGISLLAGRGFRTTSDGATAYILNQKAVESLDLENPVGTLLENQAHGVQGEVVGIIDDFHFSSLHEQIAPLVLAYKPEWTNRLLVKLSGANIDKALAQIEEQINQVSPETLFDYEFLDTKIADMYQAESNMSTIVNTFSLMAIFISGLGLFGLMAYTTEARTKEIGIRKVLGATSIKIVALITSNFAKLIILSLVIAIPISYLLAQKWLSEFVFKMELTWWIFAVVGFVTLVFAFLTISAQTIKAAIANPVDSLKSE
jgi:putative ABC transport system permease protein